MNVYSRSIKTYKELYIKGSREVKFSNGGHLFAFFVNNTVYVYKFYKAECPHEYIFKEHTGKIRAIQWFEDDTGFVSIGSDGAAIACKLNSDMIALPDDKNVANDKSFRFDYKQGRLLDVVVK